MKKILIFLTLFLVSLVSIGQVQEETYHFKKKANHVYNYESKRSFFIPNPDTLILINVTMNINNNGWALYGNSCVGCASFFYKVLRSKNKILAEDNLEYYYYYVYFYSNSYLANRQLAGTYITDINFYVDNTFVFNVPYILLEPKNVVYSAWARSKKPNSNISFELTKVSVH